MNQMWKTNAIREQKREFYDKNVVMSIKINTRHINSITWSKLDKANGVQSRENDELYQINDKFNHEKLNSNEDKTGKINFNEELYSNENQTEETPENHVNCEKKNSKGTTKVWTGRAYGVVTGDPPSLIGGGNGSGDGGGSLISCPLQ